jgi:glutamine amidotransferase
MKDKVTIVDYGVGNLYSVQRAVEESGGSNICVSNRLEDIANADKIILPGVGAFADGMAGLRECGLIDGLKAAASDGKPILGICLGMQLLATISEEFGENNGLNLIPGVVKKIDIIDIEGGRLKVPFINWASLIIKNEGAENYCFRDIQSQSVYLVHSYQVIPDDPQDLIASYIYGGHKITAGIKRNNVTGVQFHPEKSGEVGLKFLKNFLLS